MKMRLMMMAVIAFVLTACATAKDGEPVKRTAFIQTNAQCGDCKERMESVLNFESGIIYSDLNMEDKKMEVKYNSKKISLAEIKTIISNIGYDADEVQANKSGQSSLPACCQPRSEERRVGKECRSRWGRY